MGKDLGKALDQATAEILAQQAEVARLAEEQKQKELTEAALWVTQTNKLYDERFLTYQKEYLQKHVPQDLLEFLSDFNERIQKRIGIKFLPVEDINWTSGNSFSGPQPKRAREINAYSHDKSLLVEAMNKGFEPNFSIRYKSVNPKSSPKNGVPLLDGKLYFGMELRHGGEIRWFIANRQNERFSEDNESIRKMVDAFAKVLTSDNPAIHLSYYDDSPPETYHVSGSN